MTSEVQKFCGDRSTVFKNLYDFNDFISMHTRMYAHY